MRRAVEATELRSASSMGVKLECMSPIHWRLSIVVELPRVPQWMAIYIISSGVTRCGRRD